MLYSVHILPAAYVDLNTISESIFTVSQSNTVAENYLNTIGAAIFSLQIFPKRHPIYFKNLHSLQVKNHRIFYSIHEEGKVFIHRILSVFQDYQNYL